MGTVLYQKDVGDKTYYVVQAVPDTKAKTLYVVTAFMENNKKIETSQTADAYNSTPSVTSENGSAIVSANTISQPESKVKSKTSKSQTSAKKSKNKTADTVYKKNTKLKVGDTVGEVTLVADSETGTPVTPRLRASFAREDMPSYIMATIESLGDKELIAALEEEMFLMTADSEAELQLHGTIEELSEHVRDGEITPEQAAQVLSDELANSTGADIDTLVERAKLDGVKYSLIGYTEEGIEVYKTSDDILNKSYKKRNKIYLNLVKQKYIGRTARFFKNGHYYYAYIKEDDARKQVYGEKRSSDYGRKALNRTLADGEIFNLLEHSSYDRGALERGKPTKAHNNIRYWDYYVKTVQIDGKVYDLHADVKKSNKDNYVYSLYLKDNVTKKAAPIKRLSKRREKMMETTFNDNTIPQNNPIVNSKYMQKSENDVDADYMTAVNNGDMETAQRLVDEAAERAGYTMPLYHGSKSGGGFTKFRDWSYFTPKEDYARRYTQRGNEEKSLYRTYVKLDNPFDTRDPKARKEFDDIRMEYGLGEIQDTGLPDWTDGYDIADYIGENDLKYDVILLDEGGDLVDGQPVSRGISYVVRKSAQIKSADPVTYDDNGNVIPLSQRFDETNSDIRYFLGDDTDTMPAVDFKARAENIIRLADMLQDGAKNDAEYPKSQNPFKVK